MIERRRFDGAPWGALGAIGGLGIAFCLVILLSLLIVLASTLLQLDVNHVIVRYAQLIAFQLSLAFVAAGAGLVVAGVEPGGSPTGSLGLRKASLLALAEAVGLGGLIAAFVIGYSLFLEAFIPGLYKAFVEEQGTQLELLEGPAPLFLFSALVLAPVCEELFFRSFFFGGLRKTLGFAWGAGISAAVFALIHVMPVSIPPFFVVGIAAAAMYERHRSILAAIALHTSFNLSGLLISWLSSN